MGNYTGCVINRIDLRGMDLRSANLDVRTLVPRAEFDIEAAVETVRPICEDVRHRGEAALIDALGQCLQVLDQLAVAGFEHPQRHDHPGEEH